MCVASWLVFHNGRFCTVLREYDCTIYKPTVHSYFLPYRPLRRQGGGKTPLLSSRLLPYTGRDQSNANAESKGVKNETANSDNHTGNNRNRHCRLRLHLPTCPPPPLPWPRPPGNNCYAPPSILSATTWARPPYPPRSLPGPARPQVLRSMSYVASHIAYIVLQASHSERGEPCRRNLSEITPDSTD